MVNPKWRKFERLVAAINQALAQGAQVEWDSVINGRQFDVVMRFKVGAYDYLTVIECRDGKKAVPVGEVEAFVTKARDVKADKAVMVSSTGFQSGAQTVAEKYGLELFTLSYIDEVSEQLLSDELYPALRVYNLAIQHAVSKNWILLPEDKNLPAYLAQHLKFTVSGKEWTLDQVVRSIQPQLMRQVSPEAQLHTLRLPGNSKAFLPHTHEEQPVAGLKFSYCITSFRTLRTPGLDPFLLYNRLYAYKNVLTGNVTAIPKANVKLGFDTQLRPGRFYVNPDLEFSYYCVGIEGDTAHMILLESYQFGTLFQAEYHQFDQYAHQYVEITDNEEIARLRKVGANVLKDVGERLNRPL